MSLIEVRGLGKIYERGSEELHVLRGLSLDVEAGEFVAFFGPSGSGKTTLLHLPRGLNPPSEGSIRADGAATKPRSLGKLKEVSTGPRGVHLPNLHHHPRP